MSVTGAQLDAFGRLARALGILGPSGDPNPAWFGDPVAGGGHGLRSVLADDGQREALLGFVDEVLGPPDRRNVGDAVWVPLFRESAPQVTIYAVVEPVANAVRLGVGVEHAAGAAGGAAPRVSTRIHAPVFQLARGTGPGPAASDGLPGWLLLGRPGGRVGVSVDVTLTDAAPAPGAPSLGGLAVTLGVPTAPAGDALAVAVELRDLQLPGAPAPRSFTLDAGTPAALGREVFELVAGLVRAQAEALDVTQPALRPFAGLTGLLGLRDVPARAGLPALPPLPLADLVAHGLPALVGWAEGVLLDAGTRRVWLEQLVLLLPPGTAVDAARGAVTLTTGPVTFALGVRVAPGASGHPVLTPWLELRLDGRAGARVRLAADLFRADTGAGGVTAFPDLRAEAVFGADAGGGALLAGDPGVGSLHVGLALTAERRPTFVLTLHDVTLGGRAHPLLDLSSPEAAVDAADAVVAGAIDAALSALGPAGALAARVLGVHPPAGVPALAASALLADPLGAVRGYWQALVARPAAMAEVLGALRALVAGGAAAAVPGAGTAADPWRLDLAGPFGLRVWTAAGELVVDAGVALTTPVFGDLAADVALGVTLARLNFTLPRAAFVDAAHATLRLRRADDAVARLTLGEALGLEARSVGARVRWTPTAGLGAEVQADGLALVLPGRFGDERVEVALPVLDAGGRLTFPAPAWDGVEAAIGALAGSLHAPAVDAVLGLLGWARTNDFGPAPARLRLAALFGPDPALAVRAWLADLALDCQRLRLALGPAAQLLSGFRLDRPLGTGGARTPFRCPVAGAPRAPGLAAWLDPGCPPFPDQIASPFGALSDGVVPEPAEVVAELRRAAEVLPDVADLLAGRDGLADGLAGLVTRWADTDGLVAAPAAMPDGVGAVTLPGYTYDELVALGGIGVLAGDVFDSVPAAVVHVGCEAGWTVGRPAGTAFDASNGAAPGALPPAGGGAWFVRLPTPAAAHQARPDRGAVGEQAACLTAILASRTTPVAVIAYGAAGAAALRAAATLPQVSDVVTVGAPWGPLAVDSLRAGLSGDALRLLARLRRADAAPWPDALLALEATPLRAMQGVVDRARAFLAAADAPDAALAAPLPQADTEPRRAGLTVRAAFGAVDADAVQAGLAALAADGVAARREAAGVGGELPPTALHVGVDLPVVEADLGGLRVGLGATLELVTLARTGSGGARVDAARALLIDLQLGVVDGWLVGGPGAAQRDADLRWMSARVEIPLDGRAASAELVLHEARAFAASRERWAVRAGGDGVSATAAVPEVRVIVSAAVARLRAASPALGTLLEAVGLVRDGGLDAAGLDRLLFDPGDVARAALVDAPALAAALRALVPGATGAGAVVTWTVEGATVTFDIAARTVGAAVTVAPADGVPPLTLAVAASAAGAAADLALGALDADAGGIRLVGHAGTSGAAPSLGLEWQAPGGAAPRLVPLLPAPNVTELQALAAAVLPAAAAQALAGFARSAVTEAARPALDTALGLLGMLGPADALGARALRLPVGLFDDPGGWLRRGTAPWRADPVGSAVALLDAVRPLVVPGSATPGAWTVAPGVTVQYAADAGRLRLALDVQLTTPIGAHTVATGVAAGLSVGTTGAPALVLESGVAVDGRGVRVRVAPSLRVDLVRPAPAASLQLYPSGPGLGAALGAVGETVLPPVLNAVAARRADAAASLIKDVGQAVFDLGGALDLLDGTQFTAARLSTFAADPGGRLTARIPQLAATGVAALARALDDRPPGTALVRVTGPAGGRVTLAFGATQAVRLTLDGAAATPVLLLAADFPVPGVGHVVLDELRLSADGLRVTARVGPAEVHVGALVLRPLVTVRAGVGGAGFDRAVGVGLALDAAGTSSVQFRWTLDAQPPALALVTGASPPVTNPAQVIPQLVALGASIAGGVAVEALRPVLAPRAVAMLQGVVFADAPASTALDPGFFLALLDPPALLHRLERLLWNAATAPTPLSLTLGGVVTVGLVGQPSGAGRLLGLNVSLPLGRRFALADGNPTVELEVDASWVDGGPAPGLSVFVLHGTPGAGGTFTFALQPAVLVAGLGLRFRKPSGPLLELGGVSLDAIAVHVYGEAQPAGVGGGVQLELAGFAVSPAGAGGTNPVANGILSDAGTAGQANRPSFSPALAVQKHPGAAPHVSLRAGPPPGPWYVVVQRQLGPLYVERVGLDTAEQGGRLTRITLLFDGCVSLFGLTAAVDGLSLSWLGGDVFRLESWAVDLQGLAVSADMAGVSLAGGLLKTVTDGNVGYVGMLLGRFGVYGLTVFGGYTQQQGQPSFFVFGAVNGPIGGPPAFFLTGLGGGLGINRGLRVPDDLARFNEYPFIQALDPAARVPEPMEKLRELSLYFPPQLGNFWFAAGISFTCFALVDGIAVVSVAFGDGLEINLMGLARMALPRPQAALVSIELGLLARFSTREGLFSIRAQLTENSWLLYRDVRLTGGFAFMVWWKGANKGQFVLTIGGYHPSFHRDGYPEVPRVGLVWRVTDEISVKGGAYFALTSEALMAGVDVEVVADFGWAWARIGFGAHGIVYFDPFFFEVSAYARISAGVKIRTIFGTVRFGISTGASIRVWGPDFSGEATLEVGPASITVGFGSERRVPGRVLPWGEFVAKYLEDAGGAARTLSAITGRGTLPSATAGRTAAPTADGTAERPYEVFAEFELTLTTTAPVQRWDLGLTTGPVAVPVVRSDGAPGVLGLKPMKAAGLSSVVRLTLEKLPEGAGPPAPVPDKLRLLGAHLTATTDAFPIGAWGVPDPDGLPAPPLPKGDVLFAGNGLRLEAVATQLDRGPEIDYYTVEASRRPLPLQAGGPARPGILALASTVGLPTATTPAQALVAARARLFAPALGAPPAGLLARGDASKLSRASYAGDRAAPPLFGTLADGLAVRNAADGTAAKQPPPAKTPWAGPRPPRVTALLASGAGVARRTPVTTVADRRVKRRVAPTLAGVQTRLALHLPVKLAATPAPAADRAGTVVATQVSPFTDAPGATRGYVAGQTGGLSGLDAVVGGLAVPNGDVRPRGTRGTRAADAGQRLAPGDLVALTLPDAAVDADEQRPRPALGVDGSARVTMLRGDGFVLVDAVADKTVPVPPGAALVAVQAGGSLEVADGLAGWHEQTRVAALGTHAALGAGCVLAVEAPGTAPQVGWMAAGEVVRDAAAVTTRFDRSVRTVVVVLAEADPTRLDGMDVELLGAERALGADGEPAAPTVVLAGSRAALVYAVDPGDDGPVQVRVAAGGDWRVAGVLAGLTPVAEVARVIAERGVAAVAGRLLAAAGDGCRVRWVAADAAPPKPRAPRTAPASRTAKTGTASAARTPAARKAGRRAAPQKAAARTTAAKKAARKTSSKQSTPRATGGRDGRR